MSFDLHGCAREPFPGFSGSEEVTYLERVHVADRQEAIDILVKEFGMSREAHGNIAPIHMRYAEGEEAVRRSGGEHDQAWLECKADHPAAVPFWKDDPSASVPASPSTPRDEEGEGR